MAAYPSSQSSFMPLPGSTGGNMLQTMPMASRANNIDTASRAKLSKALPAPPPALDKPVPDPSITSPDLPPLPRTSSLSSPVISGFGIVAPNPYSPYSATQTGAAIPTKKPVPPIRKMPGTMTSGRPSPSSALPELPPPPPPPEKKVSYPQQQPPPQQTRTEQPRTEQPRVPPKNTPQQGPASASSQGPIRRRPVGSPLSPAASTEFKSPRLPDLPNFDSFGSLSNLPNQAQSQPQSAQAAFSPQSRDYIDTASDTQSQTKTVRPSHADKEEEAENPNNARVTSISSILSAYSQDSAYPDLSSSTSDGTISTNTSSYMSQGKTLYAPQPSPGLPKSPGLEESEQSALSYLLGGYTYDDKPDSLTSALGSPMSATAPSLVSPMSASGPEDEYDPYSSDSYYSFQRTLTKLDAQNGSDDNNKGLSDVAQATRNQNQVQEQTQTQQAHTLWATPGGTSPTPTTSTTSTVLPPRSTSLARTADSNATTAIQQSDTLSSELFARRAGGAPAGPSIPEPRLKPTSASAATATIAGTSAAGAGAAASNTTAAYAAGAADADILYQRSQPQPQSQTQPQRRAENESVQAPVAPSKDEGYVPFRAPPNPPPQSPLPTLPPKADRDRSPRPHLDLNFDQPPSPPPRSGLSLAVPVGLPGRNIRPSRQNSPATTPAATTATTLRATTPKAGPGLDIASAVAGAGAYLNADSPRSATMGTGLSKIEAKITSSVKRKQIPSKAPTQPAPPKRLPTPEYDNDQQAGPVQTRALAAKNGNENGKLSVAASTSSSATAVNAPAWPEASPTAPHVPIAKSSPNSPLPRPAAFGLVGRDIRPVKKQLEQPQPQQQQMQQMQPEPAQPQVQQQQQFAPRTSSRNAPNPASSPNPYINGAEPMPADTSSQATIKGDTTPTILYNGQQQPQQDGQLSRRGPGDDALLVPGTVPAFPSYAVTEPGVDGSAGTPLVIRPDTVFTAPPPSLTQFNCLQGHRGMFRDLNMNYPLSCQTCQTYERSVRWRCKWCYVRVCTGCRDVLHTHANHDIAKLMQFIKNPESLQQIKQQVKQPMPQQPPQPQQMQMQMGGMDVGYEGDGRTRSRRGSSADLPVIREA